MRYVFRPAPDEQATSIVEAAAAQVIKLFLQLGMTKQSAGNKATR
jgi:hypothetical protein